MTVGADDFRRVMAAVPTSVSVVAVAGSDGRPRGMTVGSLASVSLDPPLVLLCIGDDATMAAPMAAATTLAVSVLADDQADLSRHFAGRELRDFAGVDHVRGPLGGALVAGAAAHLECRIVARHPAGDHVIVVGAVEHAAAPGREPLVHHRRDYTRLVR